MGFLDSILGKTRLPEAKTDRLFAISTAAVTLEASLGLVPDGKAGVCIKPMESSRYEAARAEIEDLLKLSFKETGTLYSIQKDEYNYDSEKPELFQHIFNEQTTYRAQRRKS